MIFMMSIPIAFITAFGDKFFNLWISYKDPEEIRQIYYLTVLSMGVLFVSASIQVLYQVFIITKKIQLNSIVIVASGVITTATVFILLNTTNLGLYAIAGVSVVIGLIRNMVFTPIYAAKCLEVKWTTFYSDIFMGLASIGIITAVAMASKLILPMDSWITFLASGMIMGCVALVLNFLIVLRKAERDMVLEKVMSKLKRS